jgi:putative NADH-flavin reductase
MVLFVLASALLIPPSRSRGVNESNAAHAPNLAGDASAKPQKILIIGGTSGIGLETVKLALARGHSVTAMARHAPPVPIANERLKYVQGDITDAAQVSAAVTGQDAIVTSISLPVTRKPVTAFSIGAGNVFAAMSATGTKRLIAVTGVGAGESRGHGGFGYDRIAQPLLLGTLYSDKDREETAIRGSAVDWTIVRPGALTAKAAEHHYWVVQKLDGVTSGSISRADVAHYIVAAIESGRDSHTAVLVTN